MTQTTSPVLPAGDDGDRPAAEARIVLDGRGLPALAGGTTQPTARFRYDVVTDAWWWSPQVYALHGLDAEDVTPSTDLLLAHKHHEDRSQTEDTLRGVLTTGEPFCCRHRIVDAQGSIHTVLSLGEGTCDQNGAVIAVHGYFVDVTQSLRRDIERETAEAVTRSAETRAVIEQAKGLLVAAFRIDATAAFELLSWYSQQTNTKVRALAAGLVEHFAHAPADGLSPARRVKVFFNGLVCPGFELPD
ncbi:MAG: PAS and ANTAR domain-containing protein [Pedococcus sp.]